MTFRYKSNQIQQLFISTSCQPSFDERILCPSSEASVLSPEGDATSLSISFRFLDTVSFLESTQVWERSLVKILRLLQSGEIDYIV